MSRHLKNKLWPPAATLMCVMVLLGFTPVAGSTQTPEAVDEGPEGTPYAAGELLVTYEPEASSDRREATNREADAETEKRFPQIDARLLVFPEIKNEQSRENREQALERKIQALERNPAVASAGYNYIVEPGFVPNDPRVGDQYALDRIRAFRAWEYSRGGEVDIAVVDSGVDQNHPDIGKISGQIDFVENDSIADDDSGHGTHVAGIAGALTGNGTGIAGACPSCRLLIAKVLPADGVGTLEDVIDGIIWSADNGAEVINLSLGHYGTSTAEEDAVNYAWNKGAVVAGAAGNDSTNQRFYPAAYTNAIAVSATNQDDRLASFSNYGGWIDLAAPGVGVLSTVPDDYGYVSGTSMATPHVSALAGLISAQGYSASQIRNRMETTAADLGPNGKDVGFGYGRIDAYRAAYRAYKQVVDNDSARFNASGNWGLSSWNREKAGRNYRVTRPAKVTDSAKFKVKVPSTTYYDVYAWWPDYPKFNNRTRYVIRTTSGWKAKTVNQRRNGGRWNKLGTYRLAAGDEPYIQVVRRSAGSGYIIADAILIKRR
jgi:thermitase